MHIRSKQQTLACNDILLCGNLFLSMLSESKNLEEMHIYVVFLFFIILLNCALSPRLVSVSDFDRVQLTNKYGTKTHFLSVLKTQNRICGALPRVKAMFIFKISLRSDHPYSVIIVHCVLSVRGGHRYLCASVHVRLCYETFSKTFRKRVHVDKVGEKTA